MTKKTIALLGSVVILISVLSSNAFASGLGFGITGQMMTVDSSGKEVTNAGDSGTADTHKKSLSNDILSGEYFIEYSFEALRGITVGYASNPGEANVSDTTFTRTDTTTAKGAAVVKDAERETYSANALIDGLTSMYIEVPLFAGFYGKYGQSSMDVTTQELNRAAINGAYGNASIDGEIWGLGYKRDITDHVYIKASWEEQDFDTLKLTSSSNVVAADTNKIEADLDTTAYNFSVAYRF